MNINLESDKFVIITDSPSETILVGEKLSRFLKPGMVIGLSGELGSGKTIFTKGIASGLGIEAKNVTSPTFVILHNYEGKYPIRHFDCYRLAKADEILELGFYDYINDSIIIIEWVERINTHLGEMLLVVEFQLVSEHERKLRLTSKCGEIVEIIGKLYKSLITK